MQLATTFIGLRRRADRLARLAIASLLPAVLLLAGLLPAPAATAAAPSPVQAAKAARAEELTAALPDLSSRYRAASTDERPARLAEIVAAATERKTLLSALIASDPGAVLRLALPATVRASLPPQAQSHVEQQVELEGELQVFYEEYPGKKAALRQFLSTPQGRRIELHFKAQPPGLVSGTAVRGKGILLSDHMALESGDTSLTLAARGGANGGSNGGTPAPNTTALGEHKTLVILVNFQDNPLQPYTVDDARAMFATTNDYFKENSHQQMWLNTDVAGWFTIANSSSVCDTSAIATQAQAAASAAGYDLSAYQHLVYAFPQIACGWAGLSSVGGNPSTTWITGKLELAVTGHELGHAVGLFHGHSLECGATTLGSSCTTREYGDMLDLMGSARFAHVTAFNKERLGWLNTSATPPITTVQSDGVFTLDAYAAGSTGTKALKIPKSTDPTTGQRTWYYVEFRPATGFDTEFSAYPNVLNGVAIHTGTDSNGNSSNLLDMTPASGSTSYLDWIDPALTAGRSFEDSASGVSITADSVTSTQAVVTVRLGSVSGADLLATGSTSQPSYSRGQTAYLTANVTAGGAPVANATVTFTVTKANGNQVTGKATTGSDGSAVYPLQIRRQDPVGTYQAAMVATLNAMSANATASFNVQ